MFYNSLEPHVGLHTAGPLSSHVSTYVCLEAASPSGLSHHNVSARCMTTAPPLGGPCTANRLNPWATGVWWWCVGVGVGVGGWGRGGGGEWLCGVRDVWLAAPPPPPPPHTHAHAHTHAHKTTLAHTTLPREYLTSASCSPQ
jgi:hypothetical protein